MALPPSSKPPRGIEAFAAALFFVSGATGLVYEVVWSRLFNAVFGVTAYAVAVVLATYLCGLALGSRVLGRVADRRRDPLRFYGLLELYVAATALVCTAAMGVFEPLHLAAASRFPPDSLVLAAIRFGLASVVILPPTFLMGGTLPAMTRALSAGRTGFGRRLGFLYALNTAGAVAGCLGAGFFLIRVAGVHRTLWIAAAANAAAGALALLVARKAGPLPSAAPAPAPAIEPSPARGLLVAVAASGVASLALEVIWTRVLVLIVGGSTHAFVIMLAAFLIGIALGSYLARLFVDRLANPRAAFGWVQIAIAAATLLTIPATSAVLESGQAWLLSLQLHWALLEAGRFGIAFIMLIVPTTLIGMSFPIAARLRVRGPEAVGEQVGEVYSALSLGNIGGALLGGFVLVPRLGLQRSVVLLAGLSLGCAAWGLLPARGSRRWFWRAAPVVAAFAACAGLLVGFRPQPFRSIEEAPGDRTLFYEEGLVSTVKVLQRATDARQRVMLVDNVRIGQSAAGVDAKQQILAHLPFALLPDRAIRNVLTIGLGTGILSGEVAKHPGVVRVECAELSPSVIAGARFFADWNGGALDDPRVQVIADDGFAYLRRSPSRYEAIISDGKSRLGQAGNALFYSQDFYRSARAHLAADGLLIQWMPLEETPPDLRIIARTFMSVFPHAYLWFAHDSLFLVGMESPLRLDLDHMQTVLDSRESADLRRYGFSGATELLALIVADSTSSLPWLAQEQTINTLERPVLEFYSPRALATPASARVAANLEKLAVLHPLTLRHVHLDGPDAQELESSGRALAALFKAQQALGAPGPQDTDAAIEVLERAAAQAPPGGTIRYSASSTLVTLAAALDPQNDAPRALRALRAGEEAWPANTGAQIALGILLASQGKAGDAAGHFRRAASLNPGLEKAHELLARLIESSDRQEAIEQFRAALRIDPSLADVHDELGRTLQADRPEEALAAFREAMRLQPGWVTPVADAALLLAQQHDRDPREAIDLARRAAELTNFKNPDVLQVLGAAYAAAARWDQAIEAQGRAVKLITATGAGTAADAQGVLDRYREALAKGR